jgi:uncharacterized protein
MQTILLVDGYNMVGAWPRLVRLRDQHSLEAARTELIEVLTNYSAFRGFRTVIVFDAQMVASPLHWEAQDEHVEVCFTEYEQTADTFIEKYSYQLLRAGHERVRVATSDRAQQVLILAQGAAWLSAQSLWEEVKHTEQQIRENLKKRRAQPQRTLADRLDPKVRAQFSQWRCGEKS